MLTGTSSPVLLLSNSSALCSLVFNQSLIIVTENNEHVPVSRKGLRRETMEIFRK